MAGPIEHNPEIEVDSHLDEQSDYESASASETTSLSSSIVDYKYENGRRYHRFREGAYPLPNDEAEQDRLDIIHHLYMIMLDGELTTAPIAGTNPQRILDVGTGTGIWAIDAADTWPSAQVTGTDLSAIQPSWVPPNCIFEIDDCESEWTFKKDCFDFIHSRNLAQSIKDWPNYLKSMYEHTKPGGYIELLEAEILVYSDDDSYPEDCNLRTFINVYNDAMNTMKLPSPCGNLKKYCEQAGFTEIKEEKYKCPWGPWPRDPKLKEMGKYLLLNCETAFEAYGLALLSRYGGYNPEDAKAICDGARLNLRNRDLHVYNYHWVVVAKKPEA